MSEPSYPFQQFEREIVFRFESISTTKTIQKAVVYELLDERNLIYNLSLLDIFEDGSTSDTTVSNNQDMEKVLATVIETMHFVFGKYPDCKLFFKGSTEARTRLYRMIISKFLFVFEKDFKIFGILNGVPQKFVNGKNYEGFLIFKAI